MHVTFYIAHSARAVEPEIKYIIGLFGICKNLTVLFSDALTDGVVGIGTDDNSVIKISNAFINQTLSHTLLNSNCHFETQYQIPDWLGTAFYMVTSRQEYDIQNYDSLGRFPYTSSYQARFNNAEENIVQRCFDELATLLGIRKNDFKSSFYLSHDIDTVNGAVLEDGLYALKKGRIDVMLKLILNTIIQRPDWLNIDQILKLESEYDVKSTFFWIVNKGRLNKRERNSDYNFHSAAIQKSFAQVKKAGSENGLHKSISSNTFETELKKLNQPVAANRYHYLKYSLPDGYDAVENAGLQLDASLGFAETIGFRNSYGLPFQPYNFSQRRAYRFLEVPLHVMDATFFTYDRSDHQSSASRIFSFIEKNKMNCVLSVLWHNNYFSNYKYGGYLDLYKQILLYIHDNALETTTTADLVRKYTIS